MKSQPQGPAQNAQAHAPQGRRRRRRRARGRSGLGLMLGLVLLMGLGGFAALAVGGRALPAPGWLLSHAEDRINAGLEGMTLRLGGASLRLGDGLIPGLALQDLQLYAPGTDIPLAQIPQMEADLSRDDLLAGHLRPTALRLTGGRVTLRRDEEGRFDLALGPPGEIPGSVAEVLDRVESVFRQPALAQIARVDATGLALTLQDARAGEIWQVTDGAITLTQDAAAVTLGVGFGLTGTWGTPARADLRFVTRKLSREATLEVRVDNVAAGDIAAQSAALNWLGVLEAPISGELVARIGPQGLLTVLEGGLSLGAGALRPVPGMLPIGFDTARLALSYDPAAEKILFSDVRVDSPSLRMQMSGHAYLRDMAQGLPQTLLGQVRINDVQLDPEGIFAEPVRFSEGAADLRLNLDPFSLQIGQIVLLEEGRRVSARGDVGADADGWRVALDLALNEITYDRLLALWPPQVVPRTRTWLENNVQTGLLSDVRAALRVAPGTEPRLSLGYEFRDADVRFLRTLPPIVNGRGYAVVEGSAYTMVLDAGRVTAPSGGMIDIAGSVFRVPDVTQRPVIAELQLSTDSSITAALSFLDEPPFNFLSRANRPVDIAEGRARLRADMRIPLIPQVPLDQVEYTVTGELLDVTSEKVVPGRLLRAPELALEVTPQGIAVSGAGQLGAVPFRGAWTQPIGPTAADRVARVEGVAQLTPESVAEFVPGLPANSLSGQGEAQFSIELPRGEAPVLSLTSDLRGLGMRLDVVNWSKPAATAGQLSVSGRLTQPADISSVAFSAPGLSAAGRVVLRPGGGLEALRLSRARIGGWLDAPVTLTGRGAGRPLGVQVRGGTLDIRRAGAAGLGGGAGGGGAAPGPVSVALDRVVVTDAIALTGFRAEFPSGMAGNFSARMNDQVPVTGTIGAAQRGGQPIGGTGVHLQAQDAGRILAALGLFDQARGGSLDLVLVPEGPRGQFEGTLRVGQVSVYGAPVLADLLGALSIVGLVEQMAGQGLVFTGVEADFRLTPEGIEIIRGAASGPSLGVTLSGVYSTVTKAIDMQGVISPVYLFNVVGSAISRPGEGLFGFNYALSGRSDAPRVSVNPLSILAPGAVRDLLRSPPATLPRISQQATP